MPVTHYIWDEVNDTLLMEKDEAGNAIAEYTHEPGRYGPLISQRRNGQTRYHHYDGQGSTRALTDESGNVTDTYTYSAFGETVASTGTTTNPFGYKGALGYYANPETADLYVRYWLYCPVLSRWLVGAAGHYLQPKVPVANRYVDDQFSRMSTTKRFLEVDHRAADPTGYTVNSATVLAGVVDTPGVAALSSMAPLLWIDKLKDMINDAKTKFSKMKVETLKSLCCDWTKKELKNDQGWLSNLPACPCKLGDAAGAAWGPPHSLPTHAGAKCIRSKQPPFVPELTQPPGQQCCYDDKGNLYTSGPLAGTPDKVAPGPPLDLLAVLHFATDVEPFLMCEAAGLLDVYLYARPPNNANKCPLNPADPAPVPPLAVLCCE